MTIFIPILGLSIVIFLHELGHMLVARACGIGVLEFSIGMGPPLLTWKKKDTCYSLRLLPLGGFVKLAGLDDDDNQSVADEFNYLKKPIWQRMAVIIAGSAVNLLFGLCLLSAIFYSVGHATIQAKIDSVVASSPAYKAGLLAGDTITKINQMPVKDVKEDLLVVIKESKGAILDIEILRQGLTKQVQAVAEQKNGRYQLGIILDQKPVKVGLFKAVYMGITSTFFYIKSVFLSLDLLFSGQVSFKEMAGPIGIVQFASVSLNQGWFHFINVLALISISLGVINLFPFPVLDGGHMLFLIIEAIRKKPLNKQLSLYINNIGVALLISLMLIVIVNDVTQWGKRQAQIKTAIEKN